MEYFQTTILFIILIALLMVLRMLLAQRVPERLRFVISDDEPPLEAGWRTCFETADRELRELGFEPYCWTRTDYAPAEAVMPDCARYYRDGDGEIFARVAPPNIFFAPDRCLVALFSKGRDGAVLATADRIPELMARPPRTVLRGAVMIAENLSSLWHAHLAIIDEEQVERIDSPQQLLTFLNDYEQNAIQWYREQRQIRPHPHGGHVPHWRPALRFLFRSLIGKELQPPPESSPIPPTAAAPLFRQWQKAQQLTPTPRTQLTLLALTSLLFALAAAALFDQTIALMLLLVILFHELGHYLAMRWLGYRNLQILMLPLIGGVATGIEGRPIAANRAFVSLMGPLPGILLGWLLLPFASHWPGLSDPGGLLFAFALMLLIINYFNLLPIPPLDGGQLLKALIPPSWLPLLILLELFGAAALLWLGFQLDPILALIALIPLFGAHDLWRKRKILAAIDPQALTQDQSDPAIAVIAAHERQHSSYKPLIRKAAAIQDLLASLTMKPPAALTRALLLGLYLALFLLPPIWTGAYLEGFLRTLITQQSPPNPLEEQIAESARLDWPQLLQEMASSELAQYRDLRQRRGDDTMPLPPADLLEPPASQAAITATQQRLARELPPEYLGFLAVSNGYKDPWQAGINHWLKPVETIDTLGNLAPDFIASLRQGLSAQDHGKEGLLVSHGTRFTEPAIYISPNQLEAMPVIGIGGLHDEYLLLSPELADEPGKIGVLELGADLITTRYPDFRSFMASRHAYLRIRDAGISEGENRQD
jgi:Zn-dependent protease